MDHTQQMAAAGYYRRGNTMNTEYRRDLQHTWMILSEGSIPEKEAYPIRMLTENRIEGLLYCKTVELDGALRFYYDISAQHSLQTHLDMSAAGRLLLELLFTRLADTLKQLSEYLLDPDGLLLDPAYIYLNMEPTEIRFCWYPGKELRFTEQVRILGKALLPHLDQTDKAGIVMGYSFYQHCTADDVSMENLRMLLQQRSSQRETHRPVTKEELERSALLDSFFEDPEESENTVFKRLSSRIKGWFHRDTQTDASHTEDPDPAALFTESPQCGRDIRPETVSGPFRPETGSGPEKVSPVPEAPASCSGLSETVVLRTEAACTPGKIHRPCLKVQNGTEPEKTIWLTEEQYLVGKKEAGATLSFSSAAVSRLHALLRKQGDTYSVQDLNSRNMTRLNETILLPEQSLLLSDGDMIRFADVICLFCLE